MNDEYLKKVIRRGNELAVLERAAVPFPGTASPLRWIVAGALGLLVTLLPSVCTAQAFLSVI